jgi:hypothetical protein
VVAQYSLLVENSSPVPMSGCDWKAADLKRFETIRVRELTKIQAARDNLNNACDSNGSGHPARVTAGPLIRIRFLQTG